MTLPRSNALAGRPSHVPHAVPPDAWRKTEGRSTVTRAAASDASPLAGDSGRDADSGRDTNLGQGAAPGRGTEPGRSTDSGRPHAERVWEQRRALGRRLAALRSRSGFSQWEFAPLTGYSRSTLSDAELGRHRLRREFWQRCDEALMSEGVLTAAYDRIEALATAVRRSARIQAQAVREEQASRRLQALLPASSAEGLGGWAVRAWAVRAACTGVAAVGPAAGGPVRRPSSRPDGVRRGYDRRGCDSAGAPASRRQRSPSAGRDGAVPACHQPVPSSSCTAAAGGGPAGSASLASGRRLAVPEADICRAEHQSQQRTSPALSERPCAFAISSATSLIILSAELRAAVPTFMSATNCFSHVDVVADVDEAAWIPSYGRIDHRPGRPGERGMRIPRSGDRITLA